MAARRSRGKGRICGIFALPGVFPITPDSSESYATPLKIHTPSSIRNSRRAASSSGTCAGGLIGCSVGTRLESASVTVNLGTILGRVALAWACFG